MKAGFGGTKRRLAVLGAVMALGGCRATAAPRMAAATGPRDRQAWIKGRALARGGRYDGIGADFGRTRPATGFDVSLKELVAQPVAVPAIWGPWATGAAEQQLYAVVQQLRRSGQTVVVALSPDDSPPARCDRQMVEEPAGWTVTDANFLES